jgi:hypothetical protein
VNGTAATLKVNNNYDPVTCDVTCDINSAAATLVKLVKSLKGPDDIIVFPL